MNSILRSICIGALAVAMTAAPSMAQLRSITIGTNPAGSTFFLLGGGFAKLFQDNLKVRSTAQPQDGSSIYLPMVNNGEMTLGLSSAMDAGMAYKGDGFPAASTELRALARVWVLPYGFITGGNSGITKVEDLKGKRVMGDMPTNVALTRLNEAILKSGGLTTEDVNFARSGGLLDGIQAIVEGRADAAPVATSMPQLIEANSSANGGIRLIANGALADGNFYAKQVPGTHEGVAHPSETRPFIVGETGIVQYDTLLVGSTALSDDDAYALTKLLHENWEALVKDYPPLKAVAANELLAGGTPVPYHPGAIRYYREIGLWTDEIEAANAAVK